MHQQSYVADSPSYASTSQCKQLEQWDKDTQPANYEPTISHELYHLHGYKKASPT